MISRATPVYLDYHATTPCDPRVVESMIPTLSRDFGNASSRHHAFGRRAEQLVEVARSRVARLIRCEPAEVVFTSGATESNNLAIKGVITKSGQQPAHVITVRTEHKAVLDACQTLEKDGTRVTYLGVDADGRVRLEDLEKAMTDDTVLVSIMYANNEIGVLNPVREIGDLCKSRGVLFHCDAVQAAPYLNCDVDELGVDLMSLSGHKMYGPKGVGVLYVRRRRPRVRLHALLDGGGHERGLRSGTLNVPGIVGMGVACDLVYEERGRDASHTRALRDGMLELLTRSCPELQLNGGMVDRLPNNLNVSFGDIEAERLLETLDGVAISSGSACSSASWDGSYVIKSLGSAENPDGRGGRADTLENEARARSSLRISLGRFTSVDEVDLAAAELVRAVGSLRREESLRAPSSCGPASCATGPEVGEGFD